MNDDRTRPENVGEAGTSPAARSLLDKLGVRPGSRVGLLGMQDRNFPRELADRGAEVSIGREVAIRRRRQPLDLVFLSIERSEDLDRLATVEPLIERNGAIWAVYPKGRKDLKETDVIAAGVSVGLVDNKVVRFSESLTALRFVIPLARR